MSSEDAIVQKAKNALTDGPKTYGSLKYIKDHEEDPAFQAFMMLLFIKIENLKEKSMSRLEKKIGSTLFNAFYDMLDVELYKIDNGNLCNIARCDGVEGLMKSLKNLWPKPKLKKMNMVNGKCLG